MSQETDNGDRRTGGGLGTRKIRMLLAVGFLIGMIAVPVMAGYLSNSAETSGTVVLESTGGPRVAMVGSTSANLTAPFPNANTVELRTADGNVTFTSSARANATIQTSEINGSWTNTTGLDITGTKLTIDPEDKPEWIITGETTKFNFTRDHTLDDGEVDFQYRGPSGTTTVTIRKLPANTFVAAVDVATNTTLDSQKTSDSGVATFDLPNSEHTVELQSSSPSDIAPYYENQSADVQNETYMEDRKNATLDNVTHFITRIGTFVIGSGQAQGGVGPISSWIIALLGFGVFLAAIVGTDVGPVGGATLGLAAAAGLAGAAIAPIWIYGLGVFVVGIVVATAFIRAL